MLDRLVCRAILSKREAVVREHVDHVRLAESREAQARAHVVRERQEGGAERHEPAVYRHPGQRRGHGVLANAEVDVASGVAPLAAGAPLCLRTVVDAGPLRALEVTAVLHRSARGRVEVGRAADQVR